MVRDRVPCELKAIADETAHRLEICGAAHRQRLQVDEQDRRIRLDLQRVSDGLADETGDWIHPGFFIGGAPFTLASLDHSRQPRDLLTWSRRRRHALVLCVQSLQGLEGCQPPVRVALGQLVEDDAEDGQIFSRAGFIATQDLVEATEPLGQGPEKSSNIHVRQRRLHGKGGNEPLKVRPDDLAIEVTASADRCSDEVWLPTPSESAPDVQLLIKFLEGLDHPRRRPSSNGMQVELDQAVLELIPRLRVGIEGGGLGDPSAGGQVPLTPSFSRQIPDREALLPFPPPLGNRGDLLRGRRPQPVSTLVPPLGCLGDLLVGHRVRISEITSLAERTQRPAPPHSHWSALQNPRPRPRPQLRARANPAGSDLPKTERAADEPPAASGRPASAARTSSCRPAWSRACALRQAGGS
eukprot:scaffold895_cov315-Pinguiococcus_pyrenoidosus.AAC.67